MPSDCVFCRIIKKEIPAKIVAENENCLAFRDTNPQSPVHVLVIPRQHVASLNEVGSSDVVSRMHRLAAEIAKSEGVAERGYRTVINTNADAGQTVFHIHLHLLGGRRLEWPPG
jgi:histidine triad (HIT) family protein